MVVNISQIIKLIEITIQHQKNNKSDRDQVKKDFELQPILHGTEFPDYIFNERFCMDTKILISENDFISLTPLGYEIIEHKNSIEKLKELFLQKCFSSGNLSKKIFDILTKFHCDDKGRLWYEKNLTVGIFERSPYLDIFFKTDLLIKENNIVVINPLFNKYEEIKKYSRERKKLSLNDLETKLELWKLIGDIAEEFVFNFEKNRLKKEGLTEISELVTQISFDDTGAGYDIDSFTGNVLDGIPNRFIEVKGTTNDTLDFHWSVNEMRIAEEYGDKYWIYFVSEIDVATKSSKKDPILIQNPYKNIIFDYSYHKDIEGYHIHKKII